MRNNFSLTLCNELDEIIVLIKKVRLAMLTAGGGEFNEIITFNCNDIVL